MADWRRWGGFAALLLVFALAGCKTESAARQRPVLILTPTEARYHSAQAFQDVLREAPPETDPRTVAVAERVSRRIAEAIGPGFRWQVTVVRHRGVKAGAFFGGWVYVYTGMIGVLENEDQLAAVLAHEAAHLVRHLTPAANLAVFRAFEPEKEIAADKLGVEYMARAGYDPREAARLLEKFARFEGDRPAYSATHPPSAERVALLRAELPRAIALYEASRQDSMADRDGDPVAVERAE